jgi:hypothetical protein
MAAMNQPNPEPLLARRSDAARQAIERLSS